MITVIVNFPAPAGATVESMWDAFKTTAPNYEGLPGLVRKSYLFDPENGIGGGAYLWESREQAEAFYDEAWRKRIEDKYGSQPVISFFESPVIVDNS
jgi:hypothetical protein